MEEHKQNQCRSVFFFVVFFHYSNLRAEIGAYFVVFWIFFFRANHQSRTQEAGSADYDTDQLIRRSADTDQEAPWIKADGNQIATSAASCRCLRMGFLFNLCCFVINICRDFPPQTTLDLSDRFYTI